MILEIFLGIIFGIFIGIFTGLAPGIHVNLVSAVLVSISPALLQYLPLEVLLVFIISLAITHTFLDFIPSIFLGAPDADTALSVLPGHRLLIEGRGLEAVKLAALGSLLGLLISFVLYPLYEFLLMTAYSAIEPIIGELILFVCIFMAFGNSKIKYSLIVLLCSAALGLIVLNSRMNEPLFPLLTGMFGISTLLFSLKEKNNFHEQSEDHQIQVKPLKGASAALLGSFSGFLTGILPGLSTSIAATVGTLIIKDTDARSFLILTGSISTVNFFISIAALNVLGKARNGAVISMMKLDAHPSVPLLIGAALVSAGIAVFIAIRTAAMFSRFIQVVDYRKIAKAVLLILFVMTFVFSGLRGVAIVLVSSAIGYYSNLVGVPRSIMMACIMVPVMLYFL